MPIFSTVFFLLLFIASFVVTLWQMKKNIEMGHNMLIHKIKDRHYEISGLVGIACVAFSYLGFFFCYNVLL